VPTRIKALVGKDIERVAGGQNHTIFLRRDGVVYGCGSCKLGQVRSAGCMAARARRITYRTCLT
jgi:alpha-tubulin suppressor-like RCC1 family protein